MQNNAKVGTCWGKLLKTLKNLTNECFVVRDHFAFEEGKEGGGGGAGGAKTKNILANCGRKKCPHPISPKINRLRSPWLLIGITFQPYQYSNTVKPLYYGHQGDRDKCPHYRGVPFREVGFIWISVSQGSSELSVVERCPY